MEKNQFKVYEKHMLISNKLRGLERNGSTQRGKPFANLSDINAKLLGLLKENKCTLQNTIETTEQGKYLFVLTLFDFEFGGSMRTVIPVDDLAAFNKANYAHSIGTLSTYLRRYALCLMFNISEVEEDDAESLGLKETEPLTVRQRGAKVYKFVKQKKLPIEKSLLKEMIETDGIEAAEDFVRKLYKEGAKL